MKLSGSFLSLLVSKTAARLGAAIVQPGKVSLLSHPVGAPLLAA
jgi:hypothetical protein